MTREELERLNEAMASATARFWVAAKAVDPSKDDFALGGLAADAAFVQRSLSHLTSF
jgi:hypothetical protein